MLRRRFLGILGSCAAHLMAGRSFRTALVAFTFALAACGAGPADGEPDAAGETGTVRGETSCPVSGVWRLESVVVDGEPEPVEPMRAVKVVTDTHFGWFAQEPGPEALRSPADTLEAYRTRAFGGGTHEVDGATYMERIEFFHDPSYIGREVRASCRVEEDTWHHAFDWTLIEAGAEAGKIHVEEVWRRIE
jgi:hypothetical protein